MAEASAKADGGPPQRHSAAGGRVEIAVDEAFGWRKHEGRAVTLWFKGWLDGMDGASLAARLDSAGADISPEWLGGLLRSADGHFALAASSRAGWALAAVDWIRSIPLAFAEREGGTVVDDRADRLRRRLGLGPSDLSPESVLASAMAGYTIDDGVLYRGLELLGPGELLWFGNEGRPERHRYYTYQPWRVRPSDGPKLERELAETTLGIMDRTLRSLGGRPLVVPLSAGRDSRLVVSAAHHLGYRDVRCFTYGRAGNFEADASRAIAAKLGYRWAFVPIDMASSRRFFESADYAAYLDFADSCASVPFVQDMGPLMQLKTEGFVPDDAVLVNGNSGDYISGAHIAPALRRPPAGMDPQARWARILSALADKHFHLWRALATPGNAARIEARLRASIERAGGGLGEPESDHGLYEYAEFQDRQCKYVVTGQRIYEFLGHDWRLPLWDNAYLRFWEGVPLAEKAGQGLYDRTLRNANWGGVWSDIPVNRKTIRPRWLAPARLAAKATHIPLGPDAWHRFERRYFQYWMDPTCSAAFVPYGRVMRDTRGARNQISWLAAAYLARHGISLDALVAEAR